ncbi:MAG: hypothetical protein U0X20_00070 [Caldilineaceae bacterium]
MAFVILFGGGDAGGLIITPTGVRPIPPFDPSIKLQLRGVSALVQALERMPDAEMGRKLAPLLQNVTNLAIEQVEQTVGPLEGENALIYQDDDGGFTCGSTGLPPIPFPWPPMSIPPVKDLIDRGLVDMNLVGFLREAQAKGVKLTDVFERSAEVAKELNLPLSKRAQEDLQLLAPSRLDEIQDPADKEIVQFFQKVAEDGRYLSTWATRPYQVSQSLDVQLSDAALNRIIAGGASVSFLGPGAVQNPVAVAVAVGIVIMLVDRPADVVLDRSGLAKF